ncbi:MAG: NAD-dependent epimerase/dehydratase family protein, partial [Rhizobiales bacterium]|nr:NAD-dependent epimerase/dehydratase family protein [Hyphomicrobiales bacterium]
IMRPSIEGAENALLAAKETGIKKIIFTSSIASIGTSKNGVKLDENDWNDNALEYYALAKNNAERLVWKLEELHDLNVVVINPGAIIGPNFMTHTPSTYTFQRIVDENFPMMLPIGLSYVDVRDVAKAHILAFENDNAKGRYITTGNYYEIKHIVDKLRKMEPKLKLPTKMVPNFMLPLLPFIDWV